MNKYYSFTASNVLLFLFAQALLFARSISFLFLSQEQNESFKRMELYSTLHSTTLLHPVKEVPDDVYAMALKNPDEKKDGSLKATQSMDVLLLETTRCVC